MNMLRILGLCISAALICVSLRTTHPQLASAVALAAGVGAMMISSEDLGSFSQALRTLEGYAAGNDSVKLMKLCGIAIVAEFASDVCRDAGEAALAHRIDVGVKLGIVASALPTAAAVMDRFAELLT